MPSRQLLLRLYQRLYDAYGAQHWWPAETPFEVMVGAILTQNTHWHNVEKAISNLKAAGLMEIDRLRALEAPALAALIRPSGYFNVKAQRLKNLCDWVVQNGGIEKLSGWTTPELRVGLLSVRGVGPETADDIALYAFDRPVFVIDAYTRRLLVSLGLIKGEEGYEALRALFETALGPDAKLFNEYHALIVRHAKEKCTQSPHCLHCRVERPLRQSP